MPDSKELFIDDNESPEDIRLDLSDEEIDRLYDEIFNKNIFSIPLDTTNPEDIAALDKALDEKLNKLSQKKKENISTGEQHSA